ncbi:alpha/beta fold hydrolase [Planococcus salinus]|uniref:Alpha/beta fold hydrolase n=1 Tax=Planococcus salinus TaxID=1848460 RepID=A0A3M8P6M2_9BACL|nr:alpha/beta fold hydrolase [Planococcus salinus]RNF39051.1 alpha/beta fold hydrolase [Planococcus salinus]
MAVFDSNGTEIYYEDIGEGPALLLLHGLTSNHAMFYREIDFFKKNYRIIAPDARGHGNSAKSDSYSLEDHIQDAVALLRHLELESVGIIGVSMGSYTAQGVAIEEPDRVKKLLLVATKSHGVQSSTAELFAKHKEELSGLNPIDKMNKASKYIFHNRRAVGKWLKKTADNSNQLTINEQEIAAQALKGFDFREQLRKVTAETLVISGRHDGLNPPEKGRETAFLIPNATFMEFKRSGHAPNVEQARLFLGIAENFLED